MPALCRLLILGRPGSQRRDTEEVPAAGQSAGAASCRPRGTVFTSVPTPASQGLEILGRLWRDDSLGFEF